jgi:hypothetical protein
MQRFVNMPMLRNSSSMHVLFIFRVSCCVIAGVCCLGACCKAQSTSAQRLVIAIASYRQILIQATPACLLAGTGFKNRPA